MFLVGEDERCIPMCRKFKRIRRVVRSTMAADSLFCELAYGVADAPVAAYKVYNRLQVSFGCRKVQQIGQREKVMFGAVSHQGKFGQRTCH